ncbi:hypothetical protein M408DRAFT_21604 [Serendipita vermifera MAFF 305830]|uniref:DUF6533 domain-containing protein n=1 Tax=Serendipita vermifera MAFF 305830 TaxID=933852 RepID=A0A0C2XP62_SERVB|nr:hypothetical protein M408DRAFT_21604 [Serendipita vermifera MAFF 305830]
MLQAEQLAELLSAVKDVYHSRLLSGVAITLAVYDWLISFASEYETIYQSRWTVPKALFFYIRIITPPGILLCTYQLSDLRGPLTKSGVHMIYFEDSLAISCTIWAITQVSIMFTSFLAANALLTLRLIALYRRKGLVVWFIRAFFVATYATTFALMVDAFVTYHDSLFYSDLVGVCGATTSSATFKAIFYAPAAFEFFVFALTAWRAWIDAKFITGESAPFLIILYRDGTASFFIMAIVRIWNIWIYLTQPLSSYNLGTLLMWAVNTVVTTRVYMNLVWLAKKPMVEETSASTRNPTTGIHMRVTTFTDVQTDDWGIWGPSYMYDADYRGPLFADPYGLCRRLTDSTKRPSEA